MSTSIVLQDDNDYGYIVRGRRNDDKNAASGSSGRVCDGTVSILDLIDESLFCRANKRTVGVY